MSETTTVVEQQPAIANPFDDTTWVAQPEVATKVDQTSTVPPKEETPPAETPAATTPAAETVTPPTDYIKELGFNTVDEAKAEIERLRSTAQTPAEIKFANEESKKIFDYIKEGKTSELKNYLNTQEKLSMSEKMNAAEAIKLHLELTNQHFRPEDVQDVFEERYAMPEKPVQEIDEEDSDFSGRMERYNQSVAKVNRKIERDAIAAKQELAKLNSELVLPDISKPQEVDPNTAEDEAKRIATLEAARSQYVQSLEAEYNLFDGYKVTYKDEEVEIPIAFTVTDQEKVAMKGELNEFDLEGFVAERWFANGKPNIRQVMEDIYLLRNKDAILQKVANESGSKRLAEHLKKQSNVVIEDNSSKGTFVPGDPKTEHAKMAEYFFST